MARQIRDLGPFVAVNYAALVETLVEAELFGIEPLERAVGGAKYEQARQRARGPPTLKSSTRSPGRAGQVSKQQ